MKHISLLTYFKKEKKYLAATAVTGIVYNVGMTAGPYFEGLLAQYLYDILRGTRQALDIMLLAFVYVLVIAVVQGARALKRLFVRKFANHISRSMKVTLYHHLVHEPVAEVRREDAGAAMTRALSDADACAEGMRKFTTEVFDTGVVMVAYLAMLLALDPQMTALVILFPPIAYIVSAALKGKVAASTAESKAAMSRLNAAAVDASEHALTYRIYGEEANRSAAYEKVLTTYEKKNVAAGIWQNSPQPVYLVISMVGVMPILWFGGQNVLGVGWDSWSIATFSSFLSCFIKLATKSSHAAKLFNAVQKARVSWDRIKDDLTTGAEDDACTVAAPARLTMEDVTFTYGEGGFSLRNLSFTADPGDIIGITGRVASGKSTFGKLFLCEAPYEGIIRYGGTDITKAEEEIFAYAGHDPELFTGTVRENITFGQTDEARLAEVLAEVCIDKEVTPDTLIGSEGSELSGGQQARIALARALYSKAPVLILDDPFAAVDMETERTIFEALRQQENWRTILLISHRLAMFPYTDKVVFLDHGTMKCAAHRDMLRNPGYASLYALQSRGGGAHA